MGNEKEVVEKPSPEPTISQAEIQTEMTVKDFNQLSPTSRTVIDYEAVWNLVKGKILSTKGLEEAINQVRGTTKTPRPFYWGERQRVFKAWREAGRKVEKRLGTRGGKRMNFYRFQE